MSESEKLIEDLARTYHDDLARYCMHCFQYQPQLLPYVDDCIQEVLLAMWRKREHILTLNNPYAWMVDACKKECSYMMRRHLRRRNFLQNQDLTMASTHVQDDIIRWLDRLEQHEKLDSIEAMLTPLEQKVYTSYFVKHKTLKETSCDHNLTTASVRGAIQRIRNKARGINFFMFLTLLIVHF